MSYFLWQKATEIKAFLIGILISLNIDVDLAYYFSLLMIIDTFTGVFKHTLVTELNFNKKELGKGLLTKWLMLLIPIALTLTAKSLGLDFRILVNVLIKAMIVNEFLSIVNNVRSIKDNKKYIQDDFLSRILNRISEYIKNKVELMFNALK